MPTYVVYFPQSLLTKDQKQGIAKAITETHSRTTGAQQFFAQVLFRELPSEDWYIAGEPLTDPHVFVFGYIRAGRTVEVKAQLMRSIRDILVQHAKVAVERAWVNMSDVPATHIIEYGEILPEPGHEDQWLANLPERARKLLQAPQLASQFAT